MSLDIATTAQCWSEHTARFGGRTAGLFWWEAGPEIHRHVNFKITGNPDTDWVTYTLREHFAGKLPFARCLSLGCGNGHLERTLARLGAFQACDAYDVAEGSIQAARELAKDEGIANITYSVADINRIVLPPGLYDSVWVHSAMHHFDRLEHVSQEIKRALKPSGLLILQEYIGPNRFQFPLRQKQVINLCLQLIPARYRKMLEESVSVELERSPFEKGAQWFVGRLINKIRDGDLIGAMQRRTRAYWAKFEGQSLFKTFVSFPSVRDVIAADPSEAVRSEEIMSILQREFAIVEKKEWGGNILQFLLAGVAGNFCEQDPQSQILLKMLIDIEDALVQCGEFKSDFAYIVARPIS